MHGWYDLIVVIICLWVLHVRSTLCSQYWFNKCYRILQFTHFVIVLLKGTSILSRKFPPPLYKKGQTGPFRPRLEEDHYMYNLEENTYRKPQGDIEVILATDVEGILAIVVLCLMIYGYTSKMVVLWSGGLLCCQMMTWLFTRMTLCYRGLCDSNMSICLSVCHTPVLCLAERQQDREMYTTW